MTVQEKNYVQLQRNAGVSFAQIATSLGVTESAVKSFCRRNVKKLPKRDEPSGNTCRHCGRALDNSGMRKKKFCSDACRMAWWSKHRDSIQKQAVYFFACAHCGREFQSYGNQNRKYCCHACYVQARFGHQKEGEPCASRAI